MIFKNKKTTLIFIISCFWLISCKQKKNEIKPEVLKTPILKTGALKSMPNEWIDEDTHHKVIKLVNRKGNNRSFYFHNKPFLRTKDDDGWLMLFYGSTDSGKQLFSVNLETKALDQITQKKGDLKGEILSTKTRNAYYMVNDSVFSTHVDTHETKFIYKFPDSLIGKIATINADGTKLGGVLITKKEQDIFDKNPKKSSYFDAIYEAKLNRTLITLDVESGLMNEIYSEKAWLNHIQFSPTDPNLLMYCHEGPWHKVDRIWNINIETKKTKLVHKRTVDREIAGHEFFSHDGKTIWYDLQIPRGETFYLAGKDINSEKTTLFGLKRDEWSIHFNISPDLTTFAGDGGDESQVAKAKNGKWIYHFTPQNDSLHSIKLVNMNHHNYDLEPNVHFSPDGKWVIFRANFEGDTQIYAVEIQKSNLN